jgi:hypothetical protein
MTAARRARTFADAGLLFANTPSMVEKIFA